MDVEKVFHMNGGDGSTSYYKNSIFQKSAAEKMKDITLEAMERTYCALRPKSLGIADLGCSTGFNSLPYIQMLIATVETLRPQILPEFRICLNDLPTNDFNTVFQALPNFYRHFTTQGQEQGQGQQRNGNRPSIFVAAYPGNFYARVFPEKSLHFVFSFSSMHWLSRIPPGIYDKGGQTLNKKSIYITKNSSTQVCEAYAAQFDKDFTAFLKARSAEVVGGGRVVLLVAGRNGSGYFSSDDTFYWDLLYQSFLTLVAKGMVEEEKLESYDVHYYEPCKEEIEDIASKEGSFKLECLQHLENDASLRMSGVAIAKTVRAVQESMISLHFGEGILDELFAEYGKLLDKEMATNKMKDIAIAVVLTKL